MYPLALASATNAASSAGRPVRLVETSGKSFFEMVFIEDAGTNCIFNGNSDYNTAAKPGYVVVAKGQLQINGTATFYGVIYHANVDNSSGKLIVLGGDVSINGSIVIDGNGGLVAGSSKVNLIWDPNVFNNLRAFGTASIVQNTFREINASS